MKIPRRWLSEFVETDAAAAEIAERLTMAGIEVAGVAPLVSGLRGVLVAAIEAVDPHPAGGGLRVCRVSTGAARASVVCGAPNAAPGIRAAFAPPGASLPDGRRIEAAVIKGTVSDGMLCSAAELGIGEEGAAILDLGASAPLGADLVAWLGIDDPLIEVEVTPNRPDCLSIVGIAREVAALTRGRFRPPDTGVTEGDPEAACLARVDIEDADLCPRYAARVIVDLAVGPSPVWLQHRLFSVGLRPINNVVDVTNYVMWELGQPLHAFDHDLLDERRIVVRRARPGETLVTLDGQSRALAASMLVIADATRAVAVAGVMGGQSTEVTGATRRVLLESAYFKAGSVRRAAKALAMSTEASYRFERGGDIEGVRDALDRAARLIAEVSGGRVARGVVDAYPVPRRPARVRLRLDRVRRLLGACPPRATVGAVLGGLGFPLVERADGFEVEVPSFRRDVGLEEDLVEEVARVWGYGQIPSTVPSGTLTLARWPRHLVVQDVVRHTLAAAGCQEAVTLSLIDPAYLPHLGSSADNGHAVKLQNPLAADRSVLRPTLLFGLLETARTNARRQAPDVRCFEVGRVFLGQGPGQLVREETRVGIVMTGMRGRRSWFGGAARVDAFDLKGAVESVVEALERGEVSVDAVQAPYLEQGRGAAVLVGGVDVGVLGELHPRLQAAFDLAAPVFFAELSLDRIEAAPGRGIAHRSLPRFPGIARDLAAVVAAEVPAAEVERVLRSVPNPCLQRVALFDVYAGEQVGAGRKSLAYSLWYQAEDRTLTDAEVNAMHADAIERLRSILGAEVRGVDPLSAPADGGE
jgi:phenylalanyl-tRNA synthetase beta chain